MPWFTIARSVSTEQCLARETLRQVILQAWEEFQQEGLHATAADVEDWLSRLGTDDETPIPKCHL